MPATEAQISAAIDRLTASRAYRDAEKRLDFWAVVLLGPEARIPRSFHDNHGAWPVRVGITKDPEAYAERIDLEQGVHPYVVLASVWTESQRHALRLKARLDGLLLGNGDANRLRHAWRDISDPAIDWPILLVQALSEIRETEQFEVMSDQMRVQRVLNEARRRDR